MNHTLSVIIPAYNEEKNIAGTVKTAVDAIRAASDKISDYEILLFNDGSKDRTGEIADDLARADHHIFVTHNRPNKGFGYNVLKGIEMAKMEYTVMVPGDNEILPGSVKDIFAKIGEADIVAGYIVTKEVRSLLRNFLSFWYVNILNLMFGLRLKYYNGPAVIKTDLMKNNLPTTFGFAYMAETMVKLLKRRKASFIHVPMGIRPTEKTTALKLKNIMSVFNTIFRLFFNIYFGK